MSTIEATLYFTGIRKSGLGKPVMNAKRIRPTIAKPCCFCLLVHVGYVYRQS